MKEIFKLKDVSYNYGNNKVLDNINMEIYENEVLCILGPNGAGKTTLLKILDGLIFPQSGKVYFKGKELTENLLYDRDFIKEFRSSVSLIFQNPDVMLFNPTVFDEVIYTPTQLYGKERGAKIGYETLNRLNISHLKDRHPYNLSGGEKKKVCISCSLSVNPDVILMDEPTSSLDPKSKKELIDIIKKLKEENKTVVFVTHDLGLIGLSDRCYVINKSVIYEGDIKGIFDLNLDDLNLDVPDISKLFMELKNRGYDVDIPITVEDGIKILDKLIK